MRVMTLLLALALGATSAAQAQKSCVEQLEFPEVGRWSEYNAVFKQNEPYTMRYAVIGAESREGKDLRWLELRTVGNKKDGDIVYQMLVPGSASRLSEVHEIVMKHGTKPAITDRKRFRPFDCRFVVPEFQGLRGNRLQR